MAELNTIKVTLSKELQDLLETRVVMCGTIDCKFNMARNPGREKCACSLKRIFIVENGKCEQYEER